jgi:fucose 4-O-acetylase-like acetyltransferase
MDAERKNRTSSNLVRLSGLAAMLGGVLGIILTPILTYLWATNSDVYRYFDRAYFLVFLGCIAGLVALYTLRRRNPGWQVTEKLGEETLIIGMTFAGLVMGLVGDILEYWGGSTSEGFAQVQVTGYFIEIGGLLLVVLGSVLLGLTFSPRGQGASCYPSCISPAEPCSCSVVHGWC